MESMFRRILSGSGWQMVTIGSFRSMGRCTSPSTLALLLVLVGCRSVPTAAIAVIPRTSGTILWEPENVGAQTAAAELGERIYWNAATWENDIDGQIALVNRIAPTGYKGLVLAPDHSLALITPVRRALAAGIVIVIIGSPLPIPSNENLSYILNDEEEGGRLAAERLAFILHGRGKVALLGIDPDIAGIMVRAKSFEQALTLSSPDIQIVVRRMGTFNFAHEQEGAEEVLRSHPDLDAVVALTSTSTRGAMSNIDGNPRSRRVKVIGFDPDTLPFDRECLDAVIVEDIRGMGDRAIRLIHARLQGQSMPPGVQFEPTLVTRQNVDSKPVQEMLIERWRPGAADLKRSVSP